MAMHKVDVACVCVCHKRRSPLESPVGVVFVGSRAWTTMQVADARAKAIDVVHAKLAELEEGDIRPAATPSSLCPRPLRPRGQPSQNEKVTTMLFIYLLFDQCDHKQPVSPRA
jgi:hypothetical protein